MFSPILEFNDNKTTMKHCENCKGVPLHSLQGDESWGHHIGNHLITVSAYVPKGECPRCGGRWESGDARIRRDEAFLRAIDDFWKEQLEALKISDEEVVSLLETIHKIMARVGQDKPRQVAAELGRWLAGCAFLH